MCDPLHSQGSLLFFCVMCTVAVVMLGLHFRLLWSPLPSHTHAEQQKGTMLLSTHTMPYFQHICISYFSHHGAKFSIERGAQGGRDLFYPTHSWPGRHGGLICGRSWGTDHYIFIYGEAEGNYEGQAKTLLKVPQPPKTPGAAGVQPFKQSSNLIASLDKSGNFEVFKECLFFFLSTVLIQ